MGNDKRAAEFQTQVDNTLAGIWNSTNAMESAAADCKVVAGEPLIDRILACESAVKAWDRELASLDVDIAQLSKLLEVFKEREPGTIGNIGAGIRDLAKRQAASMKERRKQIAGELERHKASLRKVKA